MDHWRLMNWWATIHTDYKYTIWKLLYTLHTAYIIYIHYTNWTFFYFTRECLQIAWISLTSGTYLPYRIVRKADEFQFIIVATSSKSSGTADHQSVVYLNKHYPGQLCFQFYWILHSCTWPYNYILYFTDWPYNTLHY